MRIPAACAALCFVLATAATSARTADGNAAAGEAGVTLAAGEGRALVERHCILCHSLDYIQMNSVFLDRKGWEASINKMIKVMGAPLPPEDVAPVVDYLTRHYGK